MGRNWERQLIESVVDFGRLRELLSIREFLADGYTFLTEDGHVGILASLKPAAYECLDATDRDAVTRSFETQMKQFDSDCRVYQFFFKREAPEIPETSIATKHSVAARVLKDREEYLKERSRELFSVEIFLAIVSEVDPIAQKERDLQREIESYAHTLRHTAQGFLSGLSGVHGWLLNKRDAFRVLRRLLNFDPGLLHRELATDWDLASQLCDSGLDVTGVPMIGSTHFRVFTFSGLPEKTHAGFLEDLLSLPGNMTVVLEWKPLPPDEAAKRIQKSKSHFGVVKQRPIGKGGTHGGYEARIKELDQSQEDVEMHGLRFGQCGLTVILYDDNPMRLRGRGYAAEKAISTKGGGLIEQTGRSALCSVLSIVPGNRIYSFRAPILSDVNMADLSFLFVPFAGEPWNYFLDGPYLTALETRWHTPCYFNMHDGEIGHTIITGKTGSGKSFLTQHLIGAYQKYDPFTCIFDVTHSFRWLAQLFGGSYIELGRPASSAKIAPFYLPETEANQNFLFSFIQMLIESDGKGPVTGVDLKRLFREIQSVYRLRRRTMSDFVRGLPPHLALRLVRWCRVEHLGGEDAGQYSYLFDNDEDTLSLCHFQVFDFPSLKEQKHAVDALMFYILNLVQRKVEMNAGPSLVVIDEAAQFLRHHLIATEVVRAMAEWRKRKGSMMLVLHSLYELNSEIVRPVVESAATFIHGRNPKINEEDWKRVFKLSATEIEIIQSLRSAKPDDPDGTSEFLIQQAGIVELRESPKARWLYSNSAHTIHEKERALSELGVEAGLQALAGGSQ